MVGRAQACSLRLDHMYVSAQHAVIRHDGEGWTIRDLASRNGTWVDGDRIAQGKALHLRKGSRLAFGIADHEWELIDDSPPRVMVVPLDGGPPLAFERDLIALPSAEDPRATIYRNAADSWMLEDGEALPIPLNNQCVFHCGGRTWRFSCPNPVHPTTQAQALSTESLLRDLAFDFKVSLDEEHVALRARDGNRVLDLGERTHHYLLVTLARARKADVEGGTLETAAGWVDTDTLCRGSSYTRGQISVDVFRIRKQLMDHAVIDGARIIERRPGQLRIGTANVTIDRP